MRAVQLFDWVAIALLVIGGLNWGLVGLFGVDAVAVLFGEMSAISRIVYVLVAVSAIYVFSATLLAGSKNVLSAPA